LTVLPVFFALAATARAVDPPDYAIGGLPTAQGAGLRAEAITGTGGQATAPGGERGADSVLRPVDPPSPEPPPTSTGAADLGAGAAGRPERSMDGSGAIANPRDARRTVTTQLTQTRRRGMKAVGATASAAIDYLRAQVAGAIRGIDENLPSIGPDHKSPAQTKRDGTAVPGAGTKALAGETRLARGDPSPPSGGVRPATEASTDQLTAGADRPQGEHSGSSSVNPEPISGLGSAAQILIPIGLAAAVCGLGTPAIRRRLDPRAGWLRSALLASSLEQPG
jgi:hypothetical protein